MMQVLRFLAARVVKKTLRRMNGKRGGRLDCRQSCSREFASLRPLYLENAIHRLPFARTVRACGAATGPYAMLTN